MKIYLDAKQFTYYSEQSQYQSAVFVIGKLDGLHQGHQRLIQKAYQEAKNTNQAFGIFTFHPHPLHLFQKEVPAAIYSLEDKYALLKAFGVDCVLDQYFDLPFANLSPEAFVSEILCQTLRVKKVFVGYDFAFAKKRSGTLAILKELALKYEFEVDISEAQALSTSEIDHCGDESLELTPSLKIFASSTIRHWILNHQIKLANTALGRSFHLWGKVVHGYGRGKSLLGFPTANLLIQGTLIPSTGVYCAWLTWDSTIGPQASIVNIGLNPTFQEKHLLSSQQAYSVEVHVLTEQSLMLYDLKVCLHFVDFIRSEQKFSSIDMLKKQISIDCQKAKALLAQAPMPAFALLFPSLPKA